MIPTFRKAGPDDKRTSQFFNPYRCQYQEAIMTEELTLSLNSFASKRTSVRRVYFRYASGTDFTIFAHVNDNFMFGKHCGLSWHGDDL